MTFTTNALNGTECLLRESETEVSDAPTPEPVPRVRDIVLIASGKGGVGKSTVAANLACAMHRLGMTVGLLDADIFGPSIAGLLGTGEGLAIGEDGMVVPIERHGVHSVSVANVLAPEAGIPWKGPLVAQAIVQLFRDVAWPNLDVLLVDLPPGTGDVQLTIVEQIPVTGAVVVTTPQRMSTVDAERGIALFHEHDIPVFGVVWNMAEYVCPCCGERQPLFDPGKRADVARDFHIVDLGAIPFDSNSTACAEIRIPPVSADPESLQAMAYFELGRQVMAAIGREQQARREKHLENQQAFWNRLVDD